jgi:hypothetical protein
MGWGRCFLDDKDAELSLNSLFLFFFMYLNDNNAQHLEWWVSSVAHPGLLLINSFIFFFCGHKSMTKCILKMEQHDFPKHWQASIRWHDVSPENQSISCKGPRLNVIIVKCCMMVAANMYSAVRGYMKHIQGSSINFQHHSTLICDVSIPFSYYIVICLSFSRWWPWRLVFWVGTPCSVGAPISSRMAPVLSSHPCIVGILFYYIMNTEAAGSSKTLINIYTRLHGVMWAGIAQSV